MAVCGVEGNIENFGTEVLGPSSISTLLALTQLDKELAFLWPLRKLELLRPEAGSRGWLPGSFGGDLERLLVRLELIDPEAEEL